MQFDHATQKITFIVALVLTLVVLACLTYLTEKSKYQKTQIRLRSKTLLNVFIKRVSGLELKAPITKVLYSCGYFHGPFSDDWVGAFIVLLADRSEALIYLPKDSKMIRTRNLGRGPVEYDTYIRECNTATCNMAFESQILLPQIKCWQKNSIEINNWISNKLKETHNV